MSTVSSPSYLLAPNWSFPADGPIALGNIVGDPFRPHRALSTLPADAPPPPTWTSVEVNKHLETEKIRSATINLWTKVLDVASLDVGARRSTAGTVAFDMSRLETTHFEPSAEDIVARARDNRVRAVLNSRKGFRRGCVYMVTGLKVARDFRLARTNSSDRGVTVGGGAHVTPELSAGASVDLGTQKRRAEHSELANDIIFAYQLLRIRRRGKGDDADFEVDDFVDRAVFLTSGRKKGQDEKEGEDDARVGLEVDEAPEADLVELQEGMVFSPSDDQYAWAFGGDYKNSQFR